MINKEIETKVLKVAKLKNIKIKIDSKLCGSEHLNETERQFISEAITTQIKITSE